MACFAAPTVPNSVWLACNRTNMALDRATLQPMKTKVFSLLQTGSLLAVLMLSLSAHAQWGWTDNSGRRIFSDQAPASDIPDKNIFKRPAVAKSAANAAPAKAADPAAAASAPAIGASAAVAAASAPKLTGKDAELEKKKKDAEAAEAAKKKADADKLASQRAENCEQAKRAKATFNSGIRIAATNAKGEREIMSDTDRAAEIKRIEAVIAADCK